MAQTTLIFDPDDEPLVVLVVTLGDGLRAGPLVIGPFPSKDVAMQYGDANFKGQKWHWQIVQAAR